MSDVEGREEVEFWRSCVHVHKQLLATGNVLQDLSRSWKSFNRIK